MKTPNEFASRSFEARYMLWILAIVIYSISSGDAEELTGIVKQANAPYGPATESTVTVFEKDGKTKIAGPDTTDNTGRYSFEVKKGKRVVVHASWRPEESTPGTTDVEVRTNPTQADVQLQPAKLASAELWLEAGRRAARTSDEAVLLVGRTLHQEEVPAASIYQFISGATGESPALDKRFAAVTIFDSDNSKAIAQAVQEAQKQFATLGSVPTYQELAPKLTGPLTKQQHLGVLGFIAPPRDTEAWEQWKAAVGTSVGSELKKVVFAQEETINATLSQN